MPQNIKLSSEQIISLNDIVRVLSNAKWAIAAFTGVVTFLGFLASLSVKPVYQSTAVLEIEQDQGQSSQIVSIEQLYSMDGGGDSYLNTQYVLLRSRSAMEKVINQLNLLEDPAYNARLRPKPWHSKWRSWLGIKEPVKPTPPHHVLMNSAINILQAAVRIEAVKNTQIVNVTVTSKDNVMAATLANAVANTYIDSYLANKVSLTTNATSWMQSRLEDLANTLRKSEQELQAYREEANLVDLKGVLTISDNEVEELTDAMLDEQKLLTVTGNIYRQIQEGRAAGQQDFSSLPVVLAHPLIQGMVEVRTRAEITVKELARRYGAKHPKMIAARSELETVNKNISHEVKKILDGIEREYQVKKANVATLAKAVARAQEEVKDINRKQFRLQALEQNVLTNKNVYDTFFTRIQETNATADLQTANARIVDKAYPGGGASTQSKKRLIIILSIVMGVAISSGIAFLLDIMKSTLRTVRDVKEKLSLSVLGQLPAIEERTEAEIHQLFSDDSEFAFAESVRGIRTSLSLMELEQECKVFVVTSTVPGEGKTTVSSNLALSLGQIGKTLIIDCDMRKPTLGRRLGIKSNLPGLSSLLSGTCTREQCIHTIGAIDVIATGAVPPNPQELLASKVFAENIRELRKIYEVIILDCPPTQKISDAMTVGKLSDGLIYVVEADRLHHAEIVNAVDAIVQGRLNITGAILNKARVINKDQYQYGYYGYGHYANKPT